MAGQATISTVTVAAESYELTDLNTVKVELGLSLSDTSMDLQLYRYIDQASAAAVNFCNRQFVVETMEDDFWPTRDALPWVIPGGVAPLQLARWPLVAVSSVTENGTALAENADFKADKANGQLVRLDGKGYPRNWPAFPIVVVYQAGYVTIPADIADAVIRMVRSRWNAKDRDPNLMSESIPGVREARWWVPSGGDAGNLTPDVEDLLLNYRLPVVG